MILDSAGMAEESMVNNKLSQTRKNRPQYSRPTIPSQVNDKFARKSIMMADQQFARSSFSYTPAPVTDSSNWGSTTSMVIRKEHGLHMPKRCAGVSRSRNIISSSSSASTKVSVLVSQGGIGAARDLLMTLLATGQFDDVATEHVERIQPPPQL